jgi:putative transposase
MDEDESLSHCKSDCKYHVVFIPKCRGRTPYAEWSYAELRRQLGELFYKLAQRNESRMEKVT